VAKLVYMLGAGFNCAIVEPPYESQVPLGRTFFQVLLQSDWLDRRLEQIRQRIYVDLLFDEIKRYWHLDLQELRTQPFDIEECLTLFESQMSDTKEEERKTALLRAQFALRQLLLMYLSESRRWGHTPVSRAFGEDILRSGADVLTFNYDTVAEDAIAAASGIGAKPMPDSLRSDPSFAPEVPDHDLDASHSDWRVPLAHAFKFDEVELPIAGVPPIIEGSRYYAHPNNQLYSQTRVLKLHGSMSWLRYTDTRAHPSFDEEAPTPKSGIVLERHASYWTADPPTRGPWWMEPVIIPPFLYKSFDEYPFPTVWESALATLSECETLIVVGYSFPPTDFRTRRLFLEAFRENALKRLVVINPDSTVVSLVRRLTHFDGVLESCSGLSSFYGVERSWFMGE
jgi:hypothetical protein